MNVELRKLLILAVLGASSACQSDSKSLDRPGVTASGAIDCKTAANKDKAQCKADGADNRGGDDPAPDAAAQAQPKDEKGFLADVTPAKDDDAIAYFTDTCVGCHDSKTGSVKSFWPLNKDTFSKDALSTDTYAPEVFWALLLKAKGIINASPTAMPPKDLTKSGKDRLMSVVKWMEINMPAAVQTAQNRYGNSVPAGTLGVGVIMNFKCTEPSTFREYVRRVTNDVFDREPTGDELKLGHGTPEDPVTLQDRVKISTRLFNNDAWHKEFEEKGLKKFAEKVAGASDIKPDGTLLSDVQVADLKDEFYQMLLANYASAPYKDLILSDSVKVTANTASLYGCPAPNGPWGDCKMAAPRGSFFGTINYLRSKPSSFLRTNNNYGRAALMYFIIRGDIFKAAFDQSGGSDTVKPLPACLKTKDFRGTQESQIAWHGSAAVPSSANLCQSCHIARQMAAGSILYRPFNIDGLIYGKDVQADATDPDFTPAIAKTEVSKANLTGTATPVDAAFLNALLSSTDGSEQACVPGEDTQDGKDLILHSIKDLATFLVGDGSALAGGLARHLPRAMSNVETTSEEIIVKINQAFTDGGGRLEPMFKAYFESETYACKR